MRAFRLWRTVYGQVAKKVNLYVYLSLSPNYFESCIISAFSVSFSLNFHNKVASCKLC